MSGVTYIILILLMVLSAFFSGSETGFYRLSRFRLRIGHEQRIRSYRKLTKMVADGQQLILSLLLGNNLVNYLITTLFTIAVYQRLQSEFAAELYATVILTPLLFIFCEMVPKNLFYHKADSLLPRLSGFLWLVHRAFVSSQVLRLLNGLFRALSRLLHLNLDTAQAVNRSQQHQVRQIIHETHEEGLLSETQKEMIGRLIDIPLLTAESAMIPLVETHKLPLHASQQDVLRHLRKSRFSRQPVYDRHAENIVGYVSIYEVLADREPKGCVERNLQPLLEIERTTPLLEAMNQMRAGHERFALIVDRVSNRKRPVGIITISDLIEELTGELNVI